MQDHVDVVVVGGGLAGLAAAAYLGRAGRRVQLLEAAGSLGGRARSTSRDGYTLNLGPHALYRAGAGARVLEDLGIRYTGAPPPAEGALAWDGRGLHLLPAGPRSLLFSRLLGPVEKWELARALSALPRTDTRPWQARTTAEWLQATFRHRGSRGVAEFLVRVTTYADDPDRMSAGAALDQIRLALSSGVLYLDGGWQTLVDGLAGAAAAAGVAVTGGDPVQAVRRNGPAWLVQLRSGREWTSEAVVLAVPPKAAAGMLAGAEGRTLEAWAEAAVPVKAAALDLALRRLPRPRRRAAFGIHEPLYASVHSAAARIAPAGGAVLHVARYLGPVPHPEAKALEAQLGAYADVVQPGWRDEVQQARLVPSLTVTHALPLAAAGGLAGRPGPSVPGAAGLFVAGDWVGPEGMLADASLASARGAAQAIVSRAPGALRASA
jgi:phytoene dehydrogenase-like protein